ncbi:ABC transporter ATP-binding protein [Actinoplanes sp. NEAU-A12]|uniref:ABC transporter ATP-binding protein n=1 Tax=Actinoplanes sandaracinus TaxID=3045177 RepID=A0ABT6WHC1_9ACTN|nr:ABC transporter ATP-binding protein [Actinoplanes sandaracinus]MDI6099135.1 ABC transporter ATP-binding protein [Actinoplanes sandaracinus]
MKNGPPGPYRASALRALLRYAVPHKLVLLTALGLTLVGSVLALAQPLFTEKIITRLGADGEVRWLAAGLFGLVFLSLALTACETWLTERTSERIVLDVRRGLIRRLIHLRIGELDRSEPADLTSRITSDSTMVQYAATSGAIKLVDGALHLLTSIVIMAILSPSLLLVTLGVLVIALVAVLVAFPRMRAAVTTGQEAVGALGASMDRALGAIRTVKASNAEQREIDRADQAAERAYAAALTGARYQVFVTVVTALALQLSFLAVIGMGGVLVAQQDITVATLIAFLLYLFNLGTPVVALIDGATSLHQGLGAMVRIQAVEDMELERHDGPVWAATRSMPATVTFHDVSFGYPGRGSTLSGICFTARAGAVTALVGPSGAGKTTVFSLIERFYEPTAGRITLDGVSIAGQPREAVRRRLAYVEQDTPMLAGTFRENLTYAAPDTDAATILQVLERTQLLDLVAGLPDGLDTDIGARGLALSGGERQRLAVARALLRKPDVLLLDEMTSHLDTRSEVAMRELVTQVARECTVILIAHRLGTVTMADEIVVLDAGMVRAVGSHDQLLQNDSLYQELVRTQLTPSDTDIDAGSLVP